MHSTFIHARFMRGLCTVYAKILLIVIGGGCGDAAATVASARIVAMLESCI